MAALFDKGLPDITRFEILVIRHYSLLLEGICLHHLCSVNHKFGNEYKSNAAYDKNVSKVEFLEIIIIGKNCRISSQKSSKLVPPDSRQQIPLTEAKERKQLSSGVN